MAPFGSSREDHVSMSVNLMSAQKFHHARAIGWVPCMVQRWNIVSIGLPGCAAAFICAFVHWLACPFVGAQWLAPTFTFAAFVGLYINHIHGVTNHRLPHTELEYANCLGYKIVS